MRKLSLPLPMIIVARSSTTGTEPERRISPVRRRLLRWREGLPAGRVPPR